MNILSIIPARIGSKGIPEKNLLRIGNHTIVERSLFTAIATNMINDIIVSTDSEKIQKIVNMHGDYAPFIRPNELSTDTAGSLEVIQHSLKYAEEKFKKKYDYIVLLEPPCPFRLPRHIEHAINLAANKNASSVVSLIEVGDYHPIRMKKMNSDGSIDGIIQIEPDGMRRQDQSPIYIRNCAVYVFLPKIIKKNKLWGSSPFGFEMDRKLYGINIDEPADFFAAEWFYSKMKIENKLDLIDSKIKISNFI